MKKIFSLLAICLVSLLAFSGCGITGSKSVTGIEFVRDVFYVDYNVPTFLDYKVYPSTVSKDDLYVSLNIDGDSTLERFYNLHNGELTITKIQTQNSDIDDGFDYDDVLTVNARLNNYETSCQIRLKEYPTSVEFHKESDQINSGLVYPLELNGQFVDGIRECLPGEFNYQVISSNPSVIEVVSQENLLVRSTGRRGQATISLKVFNTIGEEQIDLNDTITLTVIEAIDEAYAVFGNKFILTDGLEKELNVSTGDEFKLDVKYFSLDNYLVQLTGFNCYLSNDKVFEIIEKQDGKYLKVVAAEDSEVDLTIMSDAVDNMGLPIKIKCKFKVRFS